MPLIRGHHSFDDHFTQIPNEWVRDARITLKARGLLALLMSHRPGWNMSVSSIARANGTGVDTIKSAVVELERAGYLVRSAEQSKNADGTFADFVWTTSDPFQNPVTVKPVDGFQDTKKTTSKEEHESKKHPQAELEEAFEEFWDVYPRKVEKIAARKAFIKQAEDVTPGVITAGARRMANDPNLPPKQYIPYPASWLNAGGWDSEPYPERQRTKEELEAIRAKEIERRREIDRREAAERREQARLEAERLAANPVTLCEHNRVKVICPVCSKNV